jgi:hypothetical protein
MEGTLCLTFLGETRDVDHLTSSLYSVIIAR